MVLDNGKKAIVRSLEDYLKASPAIDVCVVLCPTQAHLVAVVSPAGDPPDTSAITARLAAANVAETYLSRLEVRGEAVGGGA